MFQDGSEETISSTPLTPGAANAGPKLPAPRVPPTISDADPRTRKRTVASAQHWFHPVPFQQFQALFNSLFKVLCIFPSRYLFAIGLPPIFSFRWNLPPTLSCNPKQLDSLTEHVTVKRIGMYGSVTLSAAAFQRTYPTCRSNAKSSDHNSNNNQVIRFTR